MKTGVLSDPDFVGDNVRCTARSRVLRLPAEVELRNELAARFDALPQFSVEEFSKIGIVRDDVPRVAVPGANG